MYWINNYLKNRANSIDEVIADCKKDDIKWVPVYYTGHNLVIGFYPVADLAEYRKIKKQLFNEYEIKLNLDSSIFQYADYDKLEDDNLEDLSVQEIVNLINTSDNEYAEELLNDVVPQRPDALKIFKEIDIGLAFKHYFKDIPHDKMSERIEELEDKLSKNDIADIIYNGLTTDAEVLDIFIKYDDVEYFSNENIKGIDIDKVDTKKIKSIEMFETLYKDVDMDDIKKVKLIKSMLGNENVDLNRVIEMMVPQNKE